MPERNLEGKAAVVTGAGGGLGRSIALTLAERGARVAINDIDATELSETAALLGDGHLTVESDLAQPGVAAELVDQAAEKFGRLDILVNNAAVIIAKSVADCSEEEYDLVMAVNVKAPFFAIKAAVPHMLKDGGGSIVNIGSISSLVGLKEQSAYCTSKGALLQLTRQVAVDYASRGIRCNIVCPGTIKTPLLDRFLASSADPSATQEMLESGHPAGRFCDPIEVANAVAFLASEEASFVHGAVFSVDGGYVAR